MTKQKGGEWGLKKDNLNKLRRNRSLIFLLLLKRWRICNCFCLITLAGGISI